MTEFTDSYKNLISGIPPDSKLLIPLLKWASGDYNNIECCQKINKQIFYGNRKILILELTLSNNVRRFIRYPAVPKDDPKISFFYKDVAKYFGWTSRELWKNIHVLDMKTIKPIIAKAFGYTNKECKLIQLK